MMLEDVPLIICSALPIRCTVIYKMHINNINVIKVL